MTTEKQVNANRENALLGGVKTNEGKKKSRLNAVKHGFFSQIVLGFDKVGEKDFCNEIYDYFSPDNIYEKQLVEIILSNLLAYRRICLKESESFNKVLTENSSDWLSLDTSYETKFQKDMMDELLKFQRYKTSAFSLMTKAHHELGRHQEKQKEGS
jgi:hypothetical protein